MNFPSIRIEGAILSGDLPAKAERDDFPGQKPADFGLPAGTRVKDSTRSSSKGGLAADFHRCSQRIPRAGWIPIRTDSEGDGTNQVAHGTLSGVAFEQHSTPLNPFCRWMFSALSLCCCL